MHPMLNCSSMLIALGDMMIQRSSRTEETLELHLEDPEIVVHSDEERQNANRSAVG